jgi:hypothetical protein
MMTNYQQRLSEGNRKAAEDFTDLINKSDIDPKMFALALARQHRTLQQGAFRVMLACVEEWARAYENGNYDLRNEATCKASHEAWHGGLKDAAVPFI